MDARWPFSAGAKRCPDFFRRAFLDCDVASFAVMGATWLDSSEIVFVSRATEVLSSCVAVARFASSRVWSYCISVKKCHIGLCGVHVCCISFGLWGLWWSLGLLEGSNEVSIEIDPGFSSLGFRENSWKSSWYSPHFSMFAWAIETIWWGVYGFCTATAYWFHSIFSENYQIGFRLK